MGYSEYDIELDRKFDLAVEKEWEAQNLPESPKLTLAARSMQYAVDQLDKTLDLVNEAAEILVDTPEGDRVASYLNDLENVLTDLRGLQKNFEERGS